MTRTTRRWAIALAGLALIAGIAAVYRQAVSVPTIQLASFKREFDFIGGIPVPVEGGYRIPRFGGRQQILQIYQAPDRHLVFYIIFYEGGLLKADYYDTKLKRRLFPDYAAAMANSPGRALQNKLRPRDLKKVETHLFRLSGPDGFEITTSYEGGSLCGTPYSYSVSVGGLGDVPARFSLYTKRDTPEVWSGPCDRGQHLLHYDDLTSRFVSADKQGVLVFIPEKAALVKFDWDGRAEFLKGQDDIIVAPYAGIRKNDVRDVTNIPATEALIRKVGEGQKKGVMADLKWTE